MPFRGTATVTEVSDGLVRITGLSLDGGALGTIGLQESLGSPDVRLPIPFKPRDYGSPLGPSIVTLQQSVQVWFNTILATAAVPISVQKGGTTPQDFKISLSNMSLGPIGLLGRAQAFGILASTSITNAGATAETGDVGISPGATITGFPPGTITGTLHAGDAAAAGARTDALTAAAALAALAPTQNLSGINLGGQTLNAGVYKFDAAAVLTGTLTLDAQNDPGAVFVIQVGTALTVTAAAVVALANSAQPQNVFWQVGTTAGIGAGAAFQGALLANQAVTLGNAASATDANLFSLLAGVTLDDNEVTVPPVPEGIEALGSGPLEIYVRFH
jgi:type VI secretion system secreted protein VgrG